MQDSCSVTFFFLDITYLQYLYTDKIVKNAAASSAAFALVNFSSYSSYYVMLFPSVFFLNTVNVSCETNNVFKAHL